ncbi:rhamnan synthesis F family protein [Ancylobacter sp. WKF20]|uniref:rhamnan synthesis F family protein n=1 Tax=Ancylobacter sp. WKF20 TaxID=3039801 RepID=UPI002434477C|nr:rhamnan synthesis F family protein [Ancylobacter sp. WKF20]WGD28419.1 rhamnan synthesis F family protein [Ancylobacter sp. WKF20]
MSDIPLPPASTVEDAHATPVSGLSDLSDKPFRLRRPPRRKRRLRRLLAPLTKLATRLLRLGTVARLAITDMRENWGGAASRLLAQYPGAAPGGGGAVALYAHFAPHSGISDMVVRQLRAYAGLGFRIVFISSAPRLDATDRAAIAEHVELILHRRNFGLDFGAWSDALALRPELLDGADELLLVNDSVLGPLRPLDDMMERLRAGGDGLFGLTDSVQYAPHLQSYFLLARGEAAIDDVADFLHTRRLTANKRTVIERFEVGLSEHMRDLGHRVASVWGYDDIENAVLQSETDIAALLAVLPGNRALAAGPGGQFTLRRQLLDLPLNPVHHFAGVLIRRCGFPFLKTELVLKNPERLPEAVNWRALVPADAPVPVAVIEDHLAAYERPRRRARPRRPATAAPAPRGPAEPGEPLPALPLPPWQAPLRAAWARRVAPPAPAIVAPTLSARALAAGLPQVPLVIAFSHDDYAAHCGGVQNVIAAEQRAFAAEGVGYLHLAPAQATPGLAAVDPAACYSVRIDGTHLGLVRLDALLDACRELGRQKAVMAGLVHHLAGHAPEQVQALIEATQAPERLFWLHDFGTLCDQPMLLRNDIAFCGGPAVDSAACTVCAHGAARPEHLARVAAFFAALRPVALAPSASALAFWESRTDWPVTGTAVLPPARLVALPAPGPRRTGTPLRVAYLGARASHKGWPVFAALAERVADTGRYEFLQLGIDAALPASPAVRCVPVQVSPDHPTAMIDALLAQQVDVVINWSLCHETFSFTTHEALAAGAFVVTHAQAGNVPHAIAANAPAQGLTLMNEQELEALFVEERLQEVLAQASRARHMLAFGGASAEWLLARRVEARMRTLSRHG